MPVAGLVAAGALAGASTDASVEPRATERTAELAAQLERSRRATPTCGCFAPPVELLRALEREKSSPPSRRNH